MKDIIIIGAGGFGREVAWLIEEINRVSPTWKIRGFIDDTVVMHGKSVNGYPVLGSMQILVDAGEVYVGIGIGSPKAKKRILSQLKGLRNILYTNLVHPTVVVADRVTIGTGNIVCAGTILSVNAAIRDFATINLHCTIGHDVTIDSYATVAPGVNLSGFVAVGEACDLGTGCCVIQNISIGSGTIVGAGAVVIKDLPRDCTAVGVPAKPVKFHSDNL